MGVSSLPKTVTRQRRDCDLNLGPSVPESSTLPSHRPMTCTKLYYLVTGVCEQLAQRGRPGLEPVASLTPSPNQYATTYVTCSGSAAPRR